MNALEGNSTPTKIVFPEKVPAVSTALSYLIVWSVLNEELSLNNIYTVQVLADSGVNY